ncbi:MAG: hypothetical protein DUD27_05615 [Lachnospiraceae bacterium]|uniref:Uncharacterized protein n=1 Tax=Candidatus Weimeria bifida TaxID=2599074 RepID=A0A6N7IYU4_9FIRM|nr:hypothetical protein [Candidatus Weimeria bifida]RRF96265.1 MAG: hypothetical protein DUD27_05615 [Lachnospiraceae bacterium]
MDENVNTQFSNTDDYDGSDALLVQIDAFRDKAVKLSGLIGAKQKKVVALEALVKEREADIADKEEQIAALQSELDTKQKEADNLVMTVETQVDRMLTSVKSDISDLNQNISDKISEENHAGAEKIEVLLNTVNESVNEIKETLTQPAESSSLDDVRQDLADKIHSENVQAYRNIKETIKGMDRTDEMDISFEEKYQSLKHKFIPVIIFLIANLALTAVILLHLFDII